MLSNQTDKENVRLKHKKGYCKIQLLPTLILVFTVTQIQEEPPPRCVI